MKDLCIRECVNLIVDKMKIGDEISGWDLQRTVASLNSKYTFTFPDTVLRELRRSHRDEFVCCNPRKSIYKKIK